MIGISLIMNVLGDRNSIKNRLRSGLSAFNGFDETVCKMEKNGTVDKMIAFFQKIAKAEVHLLIKGWLIRNKRKSANGGLQTNSKVS